jgi:predicted dienelactone hydrolase
MRRILFVFALFVPALAVAVPDTDQPGRFAVGVRNVTFTTTSVLTGAPRVLDTVVWYPAVPGTGTQQPNGLRDAVARHERFPLLIFSHGSCGFPGQSLFFTTALASWGFVVAAPPHPGNEIFDGFPGCFSASGTSLRERPHDVSVTIDGMLALSDDPHSPFAHRISRHRIGISGHSLGGITTLLVAGREPRVRAALALAPAIVTVVRPGRIAIPTMIQAGEVDSLAPLPEAQAGFDLVDGPRFLLEILNTGHFAFSDVCAAALFGGHDCDPGTLTQPEAHAFVLRFAIPFLGRYLAGEARFAKLLTPQNAPAGVVLTAEPRQ